MNASVMTTCVCPNCGSPTVESFFQMNRVPAHSVLLMRTREEAIGYPRGDISLGLCQNCNFISNYAFDQGLNEYSTRYEETQGYSATFNAFHRELAKDLIARHNLRGKDVIEIGCGKGEFLHLLCEMGGNRGLGFDPSYIPERDPYRDTANVRFVQDLYSERYSHHTADFLCCKMTLEHIPDTQNFMKTVRRALDPSPQAVVFFQVPNMRKILAEAGFWDVYYEHCSYFSAGSLARLFRSTGFEVLDLYTGYDDQYLMIDARLAKEATVALPVEEGIEEYAAEVKTFSTAVEAKRSAWTDMVRKAKAQDERIVLWGGGSKAVAFLSLLGINGEIPYAVDINPNKHHHYLPGSGQEVVAPGFLRQFDPDWVIAMNPIYKSEIQRDLDNNGVRARLLTVEDI